MFGILRSRRKRASSTMALQCVRPNCLMLYAGSSRTPIPYRRAINKNSSANIWRQVENLNLKHRRLHCHALKKENGRVTTALKQENSFSVANEKVSAVLFDMDGVLCNSEEASRRAAVELFQEMGVQVTVEDFVPFMGTGEANFLGGVAQVKNVEHFDPLVAKKRFFEIYLQKYAKPNSGLGYEGSLELVTQCKKAGLKVAVASSADRIKVNANLSAAGLPQSYFDAIVSADSFEKLKPAPDIFLAASKALNVSPCECVVIEDALAGVEAAKAANMRCIAVTTTLPEEKLAQAGPSLVRQDIGNISLTDILNCKSTDERSVNLSKKIKQKHDSEESLQGQDSEERSSNLQSVTDVNVFIPKGLQASRRDLFRIGAFGAALSCTYVAATRMKVMSYVSPKAILNALFGVGESVVLQNSGTPHFTRIIQLKNYIKGIEARGSGQKVPEFPSNLDWLNSTPLRFQRDLQGKVVLLDFWTYCCINCMHVLPDLKYLENKYKAKPFTVVGVHSAKFDNEKDSDAIRYAVSRYEITHPVVNDGDMILWRELGISSWPTFVLVSPTGRVLAQLSGEGHLSDLDDLVEATLEFYGEKQLLDNRPLPEVLEAGKDIRLLRSPLKFPGKLITDLSNDRLFISDSNNHRIVVTDLEGNFILQVGCSGEEGLRDGSFDSAAFNRPQGLAYNPRKNVLYIADTENHALREIDFASESVRTLAGNGEKGSDYVGGRRGVDQVLNSPWDVCLHGSSQTIFIAMAGQHQIWQHSITDGTTIVFSGNGFERNLNGKSATSTSFAQPSGISLSQDMQELYVADSESSSIRAVDLRTGGSRLLAGGDPLLADNLFQFGDHDGIGTEAQFQHPLGVCCGSNGFIYITDSYNHKVKVLDPLSRKVKTLAGTGTAGFRDGAPQSAQLSEPAGICEGGKGKLYVADTNNSVVRIIDMEPESGPTVTTLELKGLETSPASKKRQRLQRRSPKDGLIIRREPLSSTSGELTLQITLPKEYHFTKDVNSKFETYVSPDNAMVVEPVDGFLNSEGSASLRFTRPAETAATLKVNCKVYYCKEDEVCLYKSLIFEVPFTSDSNLSLPSTIPLTYNLQPKQT